MSDIVPQPPQKCSKCGEIYPATTEYFYRDKSKSNGLRPRCKMCCKQYQEEHAEERRDYNKRYREENREYNKKYNKRWRKEHPEYNKRWRKEHPEETRTIIQRRFAKKRALPATFTTADWTRALEYFHGACAICQQPPSMLDIHRVLHQEHYIAQENGGGYTPDNIIPACQTCNLSKGTKAPDVWIIGRFGKRKGKAIIERIQRYFAKVCRVLSIMLW